MGTGFLGSSALSPPCFLPLARLARRGGRNVRLLVEVLEQSAEELPFPDAGFDTAVTTWSLCTIPHPVQALREARRVLRGNGLLIFVEHGRPPNRGVARWQDRLTPIWRRCAGGCHLNRPIDALVRDAGFAIIEIETSYMAWPKFTTFMFEGLALKA